MGRWTDLASNRWIAKADVQDAINTSVLVVTGSAPGIGDEQFISKAQLEAWVNATGSGASTQFQVKSGITITSTYYSHWLSYDNGTNLAALCGGPTYEYFSNVATLAAGERIYSNSALTTYPPAGYYSDGSTVWYANNVGLLSYEGVCGVSPYTTLYAHTVYREANHAGLQNFTSAANACAGTRDYPYTVYSSSATLGVGSTLYMLNGNKYDPYYVNGGAGEEQWLYEAAGAKPIRMTSTSSNVIDAVDTCSVPTPSIVIGGFFCKYGQYNAVYSITISNPPSGYYVTVTKDSGSDPSDNVGVGLDGGNWYVNFDLSGSAGATLYYTLELRDSGGTIVATYTGSQAGQGWWQYGIGCTFSPNTFEA